MSNDRRLVYSTENGQIGKVMEHDPFKSKGKGKSKQKPSPAQAMIKTPGKQGIRIRRESKGRGGKNVCVIDGLPLDENGLKQLLKKLKGQLGCGGAVKGNSIEIQGDHREKLLQLLESEGFKAKLAGG
ncbi:MAG: translation initiation factor [Zetaproteobacteria bacterium CG_4_9_14_3_um_filter_49_83]|nr:MAG: translation initiation factor [Zetaproteobacteria bacterium CG1_02_49_23]PIQ30207.1 MAG: translation initiation factor [Zetaproteobacteria bacterium CG17_big_fil_post_rev_8_21_14_2_50_50_13]PIV30990.1 MAG: translation initiation factor [Zetaproteobacteria bacterium CG02_land_8_20_14_3_00_50_9]PIY55150.1 MAG: translation initiation factor [Zetaproteobacteria bacterium CG_4_10_14_0_8_um_filter_49_80]PJA35100.1 MAG: translation initiation factor [Zetaproteobacteria bacterium CG_4_9_14_3_um